VENKIKNWILGTVGGILVSIATWLALQLYNLSVQQTHSIEKRIDQVQQTIITQNENIIRMQESIKATQKEMERTNAEHRDDMEYLKDETTTLWNVLINDPRAAKAKRK
jgi:uncharacterized protein YydD (DUF2326 family)